MEREGGRWCVTTSLGADCKGAASKRKEGVCLRFSGGPSGRAEATKLPWGGSDFQNAELAMGGPHFSDGGIQNHCATTILSQPLG